MNLREKTIRLGDKIFARVTRNGKTILDFVTENVGSMKELISRIRESIKGIHGVVMIHVRNFHQGWGEERPLLIRQAIPAASVHPFPSALWTDAELEACSRQEMVLKA